MKIKSKLLLKIVILVLLGELSSFRNTYTTAAINIPTAVHAENLDQWLDEFLDIFKADDYAIVIYQLPLFFLYEKSMISLTEISANTLDSSKALKMANVFFKGANVYRRIGTHLSLNQALFFHGKALAIRQCHLDQYSLEIASSYAGLGATFNELKGKENNARAIEHYLSALSIYENFPQERQYYIANTLHKLANAYRDLSRKNITLSIAYLDRALHIISNLSSEHSLMLERGMMLYNQGINYSHFDDIPTITKAIDYLEKAKKVFESQDDPARMAITLGNLGNLYRSLGYVYVPKALELLDEALIIQRRIFGDEHTEIGVTLYFLGMVQLDLGKVENAIIYFSQALAIQKKLLNENHQDIARTEYYLGLSYVHKKNFVQAIPLLEHALEIFIDLSEDHFYVWQASKTFDQLPMIEWVKSR